MSEQEINMWAETIITEQYKDKNIFHLDIFDIDIDIDTDQFMMRKQNFDQRHFYI